MFDAWRSSGPSREQADGVVAVLQRELVAPVDGEVANAHLEAMMLEYAVSRPSADVTRRARRVPRAILGTVAVVGALTFTGGLGAAGALPAPAQHWLSHATRVFGIHIPDRSSQPTGESRPTAPNDTQSPRSGTPAGRAPTRVAPTFPAAAETAPPSGGVPDTVAVPVATRPATPGNGNANGVANGIANGVANGVDNGGANPASSNAGGNGKSQAAEHANANAATSNAGGNGKSQAAEHANDNAATSHAATSNAGGNGKSQAATHVQNAPGPNGNGVAKGKSPAKITPTPPA